MPGVALRTAGHAERCDVDQNIGPDPFRLRLPLKTVLFRQRQAAVAIAGGDNHIAKTGVAKAAITAFPMPPLP